MSKLQQDARDQKAAAKQSTNLTANAEAAAQKAMRERPSMIAAAKWYQRLFFSWAFEIITVSDICTLLLK